MGKWSSDGFRGRVSRFFTRRIRTKAALFWVLSAIWLWVIYSFGGQTGEESAELSLSFTETLGKIFPFLFGDTQRVHLFVRKLAHFSVFAVEAALLYFAARQTFRPRAWVYAGVFLLCALFAAGNEIEQMFVMGRGPSFWDVVIDSVGALCGMIVARAFVRAGEWLRARKGKGTVEKNDNQIFDARTKWLCAAEFAKAAPICVFHREMADSPAPAHDPALTNLHMYARRAFRLGASATRAEIIITADDYYKLYINGAYVAQGPASGYPDSYYVNRVDVLKYLRAGDNVIALDVYYQGKINRVWVSGDMRQGFMCELRVDGRTLVRSDEHFHYMRSQSYETKETFGYETQFAEHFDAREEPKGWKNVGFDDFMWMNCAVKPKPDYTFAWQETPVLQTRLVSPALIAQSESRMLYDFGREISGVVILEAEGKAGARVTVHTGEELTEDGMYARWQTRANCKYEDTWTLADGRDVWEMYDYRGFRYLEVELQGEAKLLGASARAQHYPLDENACTLTTSDQALKDIFELCKNSMCAGVQEAYIDCPTREKGQYSGDLAVTSLSHIYISGDTRLLRKALSDWMRSSFITEGLMAVFPSALMQEIADYSFLFPMVAWRDYEHTGDEAFLKQAYGVCDRMLAIYGRYAREDGLLANVTEAWNLVDWPQNLRDDYDFPLSKPIGPGCHNVINAFYIGALMETEKIAARLGIAREPAAEARARAFDKVFFRPDTRLYADAENSAHSAVHSCILPLFFGFAPKEYQAHIADWLISQGMRTGVYMAFFLLKALARAGRYDAAYDFITGGGVHSWKNMLAEGATTLFEAWGKDQKWNTSLCHPWASAPVAVLVEDILGITPEVVRGAPWRPHLPARVESLHMEVPIMGKRAVFTRDEFATTLDLEDMD